MLSSYSGFSNVDYWKAASGLPEKGATCTGENPGDVPAHFTVTKSSATGTIEVGDAKIELAGTVYNLIWDSKTGMVSGTETTSAASERKPVAFTGNSCGAIPVGGTTISLNGATLKYYYWYY